VTAAPDHARAAYDGLAPAYDLFTGGHDHAAWARLLEALARQHGLAGCRLLDVGCGTGSALLPMVERGYDVTGVDVSPRMLDVAREKLPGEVDLVAADMRSLPDLGGDFDLVWSVADAVNYLHTHAELVAAFEGFRRSLAPGGVVVFDVDTLGTFRALYSSLMVVLAGDRAVVFEGRSTAPIDEGALGEAWIDRLERAAEPPWWNRVRTVHRQRHHPRAALERALAAAGLVCVAVWGTDGAGGIEQPLDELRHSKAVYIAQHAAPAREGR
jgi:SAM-dependent methyltransferase